MLSSRDKTLGRSKLLSRILPTAVVVILLGVYASKASPELLLMDYMVQYYIRAEDAVLCFSSFVLLSGAIRGSFQFHELRRLFLGSDVVSAERLGQGLDRL